MSYRSIQKSIESIEQAIDQLSEKVDMAIVTLQEMELELFDREPSGETIESESRSEEDSETSGEYITQEEISSEESESSSVESDQY